MDKRSNTAIESAVQKGRVAAYTDDFLSALNSMAQDGVPKAVIERIFIYQQRCRSTDMGSMAASS
jgi:hypothetical protein